MEQAEEEEAAVSYSLIEPEELQAAPQATGRDVTSGVTSSSIDFSVSIAPNLGLGFASTTYQQEVGI